MVQELFYGIKKVYNKNGLRGCWNEFLGLVSYKLHLNKLHYQPVDIQIEPTSKCNLSCIMCGRTYLNRMNGNMNYQNFKKIINQFLYLRFLTLQGLGEPLLNPDIFKMIKFAKSKGIEVRISSNATLLTPENSKKLVSTGLDSIYLSIDGASPKTYKSIRKGANFDLVINNIEVLMKTKKMLKKDLPRVTLDIVGMRTNLEEIPKMVKLAHSLGIENVNVRHLYFSLNQRNTINLTKSNEIFSVNSLENESLFNQNPEKVNTIFKAALKTSNKLGINLHLPSIEPNILKQKEFKCRWPWLHTYIDFEGNVTPCCICPDKNEICFGNILNQPFNEIWNSKPYREFRYNIASHNFPKVCNDCMRPINVFSSFNK